MNEILKKIHFHDSVLHKVIENTQNDSLEFHVDYPVDWESGRFEVRVIVFSDTLEYSVNEGPFSGPPTMLAWSIIDSNDGRDKIRIETNAGFRTLYFRSVKLLNPNS